MDEIPTAPNSPADTSSQAPSPVLSLADWSEIDMVSSIESLSRRSPHLIDSSTQQQQPPLPRPPQQQHQPQIEDSFASVSTSSSNYGFVMPSLPRPSIVSSDEIEPVVGCLSIAVVGSAGHAVLTALTSQMYDERMETKQEDGLCLHTCSSSAREHGNITFADANFVPHEIAKWLETQAARDAAVDLVVYTINSSGASEDDYKAMAAIQQLAELAVVVAHPGTGSGTHQGADLGAFVAVHESGLYRNGIFSVFQKRVWVVNTAVEPNMDMTASAVESPQYREVVPSPTDSEVSELAQSVKRNSGRIRAAASQLHARWLQSQLVVTVTEPVGALAKRVNLRRKALESIGNLDPLGIAHWWAIPRLSIAIVAGIVSGAVAAISATALCSRFASDTAAIPPTCRRHALFDMENWPQWLV